MNSMTETIPKKGDNNGSVTQHTPIPDEAHIPSTVAAATSVALASEMTNVLSNMGGDVTTQKQAESVTLLASVPVAEYASQQKEVTLTTSNI
jgi:hypothetical protein